MTHVGMTDPMRLEALQLAAPQLRTLIELALTLRTCECVSVAAKCQGCRTAEPLENALRALGYVPTKGPITKAILAGKPADSPSGKISISAELPPTISVAEAVAAGATYEPPAASTLNEEATSLLRRILPLMEAAHGIRVTQSMAVAKLCRGYLRKCQQ